MKAKALPKPRDPFVQHLVKKKQGPHGKSYKTHRRNDKVALKKSTDYSDKRVVVFLNSLVIRVFCIPGPIIGQLGWSFKPTRKLYGFNSRLVY